MEKAELYRRSCGEEHGVWFLGSVLSVFALLYIRICNTNSMYGSLKPLAGHTDALARNCKLAMMFMCSLTKPLGYITWPTIGVGSCILVERCYGTFRASSLRLGLGSFGWLPTRTCHGGHERHVLISRCSLEPSKSLTMFDLTGFRFCLSACRSCDSQERTA